MSFSYAEFITRNHGFVTLDEQETLRTSHVLIIGVGGMGGSAAMVLARSGVGALTVADIDTFEISNLNRQVFATLDTVGAKKADTARDQILKINPHCKVRVYGADWVDKLDAILEGVDLVINGCDDVRATLLLMRRAKVAKKTVIDAFASTLPSVYVVKADHARPEELFDYPSVGTPIDALTEEQLRGCAAKETEYVLTHSSTADHVDIAIAAEMINGQRPRISFAPMVIMTGCLMGYEAIRSLLNRPGGPGTAGIFYNPWTGQTERPKNPLMAYIRRFFVRRFLSSLEAPSAIADQKNS